MAQDRETQAALPGWGRILLGVYLVLVTALFAYVTAKLWPQVGPGQTQTQTTTQTTGSASAPQNAQQPVAPASAPSHGTNPPGQATTQTTGSAPAPQNAQQPVATAGAASRGTNPPGQTTTPQPVAPGGPPSPDTGPPGQTTAQKEPYNRPVQLFWGVIVFYITAETRLILLVLAVGALGGCVHAATSFVSFAGKDELHASWIWWYLLRAPMSGALALITYFAVRGGFFSAGTASTGSVNDFGIAAMAGLVGMFTKQATAKLDEVFTTLFRTAPPAPSGGPPANKVPALSAVTPAAIPHGSQDTTITVTGDGFVDKSEVRWNGVALATQSVKTGQLTATVPAAKLAAPGSFDVTVFNPAPGGGSSPPVKVAVS